MEEQLITYPTAVLAKEKGFSEQVEHFWTTHKIPDISTGSEYQSDRNVFSNWNNGQGCYPTTAKEVCCSAPTQSLLQKWLREVHNIHILMNVGMNNGIKQTFYCNTIVFGTNLYESKFRSITSKYTYEEALEAGIFEGLKLIKTT